MKSIIPFRRVIRCDQDPRTAHEVKKHLEVQPSAVKKEHNAVNMIKAAILSHGNLFDADGDHLKMSINTHMFPGVYPTYFEH